MKKLLLLMLVTCSLAAQQKETTLGNCNAYRISGNTVTFDCSGDQKVQLQFCGEEVVRVWVSPKGDFQRSNASFAVINEDLGWQGEIKVQEEAAAYEIFTGALRVRINRAPFSLQIFDKYQKLLMGDYKDRGVVHSETKSTFYKALRSDEHFIGLGEKTGKIDRRGRSFRMWNSDQPCYGVSEDPIYKSIPFFMSSKRYGIFFDNTYKTDFKFGSEADDYYSFSTPGGALVYYFIYGPDFKDMLGKYIKLTGNPIMPPKWALGFSQCRGMYTREDLAREVATEFRKRQIPCDIIYQDIGWTDGLQNFEWRKGNYTNPKQMIKDLEAQGFKMIVSQDPVISKGTSAQFQEADAAGYFAKDIRTGKTYDMPWPWGGNCGVVDFTKPEVADWWGAYQQKPLDDGVRGFWTDMGEPAWSNEDAVDRLNMKHQLGMHDEIHNVYGFTWDKVVTEQFYKRNPNKRIFQMTRASFAGLQRYSFGWSGDSGNGDNVAEGWAQMANQIPVGVSAGLGLIPFWTCDISGYCGDIKDYPAMAELYTRWMQFGIFTPLTRAHHEGDIAVEPWMFGPEAEKNAKSAIELKYRLIPYFYTLAREAYDTGVPLMRAMPVEFPADEESYRLNGQFMLGKSLLVAPVVEKGADTKEVYLPQGDWIDFNDKTTIYKGGKWITVNAPLNKIPMFAKRGSIVPGTTVQQFIGQNPSAPVIYEIFPSSTEASNFELYEDDGENRDYERGVFCKTNVSATSDNDKILIKTSRKASGYQPVAQRNIIFNIHTDKKPKSVHGASGKIKKAKPSLLESLDTEFQTVAWTWDEKSKTISIRVPDTGSPTEFTIQF